MSTEFNRYRCLYLGHLLHYAPVPLPDGRFRARVVITALEGDYTIAQRFLDLEEFGSEADAVACARAEGRSWVDTQVSMARSH
jgi:hypothetical protein